MPLTDEHPVYVTEILLSDGRELRYFDSVPTVRDAVDERGLTPAVTSSELRYDPLLDQWIMIASHRQERTFKPSFNDCPLCASKPDHQTEIPADDYEVVVFSNRFPALTAAPDGVGLETAGVHGSLQTRPGQGRCEVICFTPDHDASVASLTPRQVELILQAWTHRTVALSSLPGVEQVFCFANSGDEIGVTLEHPHGQIYAYPFVAPRTSAVLRSVADYRERTGRNLFDDRVADEVAEGSRIVLHTERWIAFVPHAARWPYEVHVYPTRRVPDLAALTPIELTELAQVYSDLLGRFERLFDRPAPYIAAWHQAPVRAGRDDFALHLELFTIRRTSDKLKYLAGSESGMDAFANDVSPEDAAAKLRELAL